MSLNSSSWDNATLPLEVNKVPHSGHENLLKPWVHKETLVKVWNYFEIHDKFYQVVRLSTFDWWPYLIAKQVNPFDSVEIAFLPEEVIDNMIPESAFITRKVDQILNIPSDQILPYKDNIIKYPYMDKYGIPRATMDDVRRVNEERYADLERARLADERRRKTLQPQYNRKDLMTKIPEPYFNKHNLDV